MDIHYIFINMPNYIKSLLHNVCTHTCDECFIKRVKKEILKLGMEEESLFCVLK